MKEKEHKKGEIPKACSVEKRWLNISFNIQKRKTE